MGLYLGPFPRNLHAINQCPVRVLDRVLLQVTLDLPDGDVGRDLALGAQPQPWPRFISIRSVRVASTSLKLRCDLGLRHVWSPLSATSLASSCVRSPQLRFVLRLHRRSVSATSGGQIGAQHHAPHR